ncbi:MAG: hypothetical protein N2Z84_04205 [Atribacterota bacterium]|nr:hypothetical protein [Atribacterota bacterium]
MKNENASVPRDVSVIKLAKINDSPKIHLHSSCNFHGLILKSPTKEDHFSPYRFCDLGGEYPVGYLIYAAYGSNMVRERFMVYIKGGYFRERWYPGSSDTSDPEDLGWMYVPHRLYFAKKSPRWENKGVAFLSCYKEPDSSYHAVVRLWKVSEIQFRDIQEQEGKSWYDQVLPLGEKEGLEIKTITGSWEHEKQKPSECYLEIVRKGLSETTGWDEAQIEAYLARFL